MTSLKRIFTNRNVGMSGTLPVSWPQRISVLSKKWRSRWYSEGPLHSLPPRRFGWRTLTSSNPSHRNPISYSFFRYPMQLRSHPSSFPSSLTSSFCLQRNVNISQSSPRSFIVWRQSWSSSPWEALLFPRAPLAKIPFSFRTTVTAPVAEDPTNYEHLESLGGAVLTSIVSVNLIASFPF